MRVIAVINRRAGALVSDETGSHARSIEAAIREREPETRVVFAEPEDIEAELTAAVGERPDLLLVGGGDGTIRTAATLMLEQGGQGALAIMPLGTLNRLARDLEIPFEPTDAIAVAFEGDPHPIDIAEVNGNIFLCNSLLGLPIRVAEQRQSLRGKPLGTRIAGYLELAKQVFRNRRRLAVQVDGAGEHRIVRAMSIAVSNNAYEEGVANLFHHRPRLDRGELALYISTHRTGLGMVKAFVASMFGRWRADPAIEVLKTSRITLSTRRPIVRVSNDGEIEELAAPLVYAIRPKALTVIRLTNEAGCRP